MRWVRPLRAKPVRWAVLLPRAPCAAATFLFPTGGRSVVVFKFYCSEAKTKGTYSEYEV